VIGQVRLGRSTIRARGIGTVTVVAQFVHVGH
jgi:hypothetical protein